MTDRSGTGGFGNFALGGAVGFGLYFLLSLGFGLGRRGEGRGEVSADLDPLLFRLGSEGLFLIPHPGARNDEGQKMTSAQAIQRILAGQRRDVRLIITGAAITDDVEKLKNELLAADIRFSILETVPSVPAKRVSGNARGYYGRSDRRSWSTR